MSPSELIFKIVWLRTSIFFKKHLAVLAGGRYDDLSKLISKQNFPGVGWAAGIERLSMLLDYKYKFTPMVGLIGHSDKYYHVLLDYYKKFLNNKVNAQIIYNGTLSKKV